MEAQLFLLTQFERTDSSYHALTVNSALPNQ